MKRRYNGRRKYRRRNPYFNKEKQYERYSKRMTNQDPNWIDEEATISQAADLAYIDQASPLNCWVAIPQGTGQGVRARRKVHITSINMKIRMLWERTNAIAWSGPQQGTQVTLMLVVDTQTNGATTTLDNIFDNKVSGIYRNVEFRNRFKILKSKKFLVNFRNDAGATESGTTLAMGADVERNIDWYIKFKTPVTQWYTGASTGGGIGNQPGNSFHIVSYLTNSKVALKLDGTIITTYPQFEITSRTFFYD